MELTTHIGDSRTFRIPLRWEGRSFSPDENWAGMFTVKTNEDDADDAALIQKATGAGIVIAGDDALVTIIPIDTRGDAEADPVVPALTVGTKYWGIVFVHADGRRRHANWGTLDLLAARSTEDETSVPIYTTSPPAPHSVQGQINAASQKTTPANDDRIPLTDSADGFSLKWFSWANLKATAKTYFDTFYASIGHNHTGVYDPAGSASSAQAYAIQRANHTGTQAHTTITGLGNSATRNVGTTTGTVAAGDDSRLSDARTPTAHTHPWSEVTDKPATFPPTIGSGSGDAVAGDDPRLSDARTPTAHASTHAVGGDDPLFDQNLNTSDVVGFDHVGANSVSALGGNFDEIRSLRPGFPPAFPDGVTDVVAGNITTFPAAGGEVYTTVNPQPTADPNPHASTHATGGDDPLTPSDIGAQPAGDYLTKRVVSGNTTAADKELLVVTATATITDPTPEQGLWFRTQVENGTATVGGTGYSTAGTIIDSIYHSGSWRRRVYQVASTFATAAQGSLADSAVQPASTNTLTNKRITPRVTSIASSATPTINTDNCDAVDITALATAITSMSTNLTGTPTNFQPLMFRIKDNGTARAITWGASFVARGGILPTTTVANKLWTVYFLYNTATSTWGCVSSSLEV